MTALTPIGAPTSAAPPPAELKAAAEKFEAIFLRQLLGAARAAKLADGLLDSSSGDQFREMRDADLADRMATGGGLGIAAAVVAQLSRRPGGAK